MIAVPVKEPREEPDMFTLFARVSDGAASADEMQRLGEMLQQDERVRQLWLEFAAAETGMIKNVRPNLIDLPRVFTPPAGSNSAEPATNEKALPRLKRMALAACERARQFVLHYPVISCTVAALFVVAVVGLLALVPQPGAVQRPRAAAGPTIVARLTKTRHTRWAPEQVASHQGAHLVAGHQLDLREGVIEITFRGGARVVIEGPAKFQLLSDREGRLAQGNLTAKVDAPASAFVIATPTARVVDLGTEFGVSVDSRGRSKVVVFAGKVAAQHARDGELLGEPVTMVAGQSIQFGYDTRPAVEEDAPSLASPRWIRVDQFPQHPTIRRSFGGSDAALAAHPASDDLIAGELATSSLPVMPEAGLLTDGRATARYGSGLPDGRVLGADGISTEWVLTYDLSLAANDVAEIREVRVFSHNIDARVFVDFDVAVSTDGKNWRMIAQNVRNAVRGKDVNLPAGQPPDYFHDFTLTQVILPPEDAALFAARFIRLTFRGPWGDQALFGAEPSRMHSALYEIDVLGKVVDGAVVDNRVDLAPTE